MLHVLSSFKMKYACFSHTNVQMWQKKHFRMAVFNYTYYSHTTPSHIHTPSHMHTTHTHSLTCMHTHKQTHNIHRTHTKLK